VSKSPSPGAGPSRPCQEYLDRRAIDEKGAAWREAGARMSSIRSVGNFVDGHTEPQARFLSSFSKNKLFSKKFNQKIFLKKLAN